MSQSGTALPCLLEAQLLEGVTSCEVLIITFISHFVKKFSKDGRSFVVP